MLTMATNLTNSLLYKISSWKVHMHASEGVLQGGKPGMKLTHPCGQLDLSFSHIWKNIVWDSDWICHFFFSRVKNIVRSSDGQETIGI